MTKTGHIATITQLEDAAITTYDKRDLGDSINIIDKDIDNQIHQQEDLVNNNDSKGIVLGTGRSPIAANTTVKFESEKVINEKVRFTPEGYKVLGIQFISRLKWDKIISISIIHMLFIYTFLHITKLPKSLWTYPWGEYITKLCYFLLFSEYYYTLYFLICHIWVSKKWRVRV